MTAATPGQKSFSPRQSSHPLSSPRCELSGGRWWSYDDAQWVTSASSLDIDHVDVVGRRVRGLEPRQGRPGLGQLT